jgi:SAM-dependent methyltransferase
MASSGLYDSERLARAYAFSRPPVHREVVERIRGGLATLGWHQGRDSRGLRALDVGCGAGLSTAALAPLARHLVGLEPAVAMLTYRHQVAPGAAFVVGRAESLPFASGSFDLLASAGALNYADRRLFLPEAARVLTSRGCLVVYDFSSGRRLREAPGLDAWFDAFEQRYPYPPGYAMDVRTLAYEDAGLRLQWYETFDVELSMTRDAYVAYALSETSVELALSRGTSRYDVERWCRETLEPWFPSPAATVVFEAYAAVIGKAARNSA